MRFLGPSRQARASREGGQGLRVPHHGACSETTLSTGHRAGVDTGSLGSAHFVITLWCQNGP